MSKLEVKKGPHSFKPRGHGFLSFYCSGFLSVAFIGMLIYKGMDADNEVRREEVLGSMCDQRARVRRDQFSVGVNHVHALAILIFTFHYSKNVSAIDQETVAEYTARTAFERPFLIGVAFAQRVGAL